MSAEPLVHFQSVSYSRSGKSLTLTLAPGDRVAVFGSVGSGTADLLRSCLGGVGPETGSVEVSAKVVQAGLPNKLFKATPLSLARSVFSGHTTRVAGVLSALDLWEVRDMALSKLCREQLAAAELISVMAATDGLMVVDGQFDELDPRVLDDICEEISGPDHAHKAYLVATASPWIVERLGTVVVMRNKGAVYAGTVSELISQQDPVEVVVETEDSGAALAIADPFTLSVRSEPGQLIFQSHDGQALAARLLTEGYGAVRTVVVRTRSVAEALLSLC